MDSHTFTRETRRSGAAREREGGRNDKQQIQEGGEKTPAVVAAAWVGEEGLEEEDTLAVTGGWEQGDESLAHEGEEVQGTSSKELRRTDSILRTQR